jgi:hypothetical protein
VLRRRFPTISPHVLHAMFTTHVRSKLQYGAQLWAAEATSQQRQALDRMQRSFQRSMTSPPGERQLSMPYCFAEGEYGTLPVSAHCDVLALRYFWRLAHAPTHTTLHRVFDARWRAARTGNVRAGGGVEGSQGWAWSMCDTFKRYGLQSYWDQRLPLPSDKAQWTLIVRRAVRKWWYEQWRAECKAHAALAPHLHRQPAKRRYLQIATPNSQGRALMAQVRAGILPIGVYARALLRRTPNVDLVAANTAALCGVCLRNGKAVEESLEHFLCECDSPAYQRLVLSVHERAVALSNGDSAFADAFFTAPRQQQLLVLCGDRANGSISDSPHVYGVRRRFVAGRVPLVSPLRKVSRAVADALAFEFQNFLSQRWRQRTRAMGGQSTRVAIAPKCGLQVMVCSINNNNKAVYSDLLALLHSLDCHGLCQKFGQPSSVCVAE